ncbi:OmpA family protein [Reichenbachiella versicolor]|uniref:OmpA family protein n=1 Tax=Reichenbachiella versicolor TaxID=1821036 RepID=UPI000D6EA158|nr:OmpA family protein [Reichenbachiella versicolor]
MNNEKSTERKNVKNLQALWFFFILGFVSSTSAQESVQWASEVMHVSSEQTALQYAATQALHAPNIYPRGGASPNAWRPASDKKEEHIVVKFDKPIHAQQIAIAETENPGAVSKVFAYDSLDNEHLLFELNARPIPLDSRLLNLFFERTSYKIAYVRIDLACGVVPGYNGIDAIGISDSNIPISVLIKLAPNVNENLVTEKLSNSVNSTYNEQSPVLSPDGKTLFFSRRGHPDNIGGVDDVEDIWYSKLDPKTGEWLPAKNIGKPLNTWGPNYICSATEVNGELTLLLGNQYGKRGQMLEGISITKLKPNGKWEYPVPVKIDNAYNYSDQADFYMSQDASVIILSQERDDSNGDRDLYVSFENKKTNIWSEPLSLGSVINSVDTDYAPFLDGDNKTLYFSSKGFRSYGGADIYVSKRLDDTWTNWSEPENMGKGINGKGDDTYFNIPSSGDHAYFTKGVSNENTDVYRFRIDELFLEPKDSTDLDELDQFALVTDGDTEEDNSYFMTVNGKILDQNNAAVIGIVVVERLPDGALIGETATDEFGEFKFLVRSGARYAFTAKKDGYVAKGEHVDLNNLEESSTMTLDLHLQKIQEGAEVVLNNIFFDFDEANLKTSSYAELERILGLLTTQQIENIKISGHTDSVGDDDYNRRLSDRRANAVRQYFIDQGIDQNRLVAIGYGETRPKYPNSSKTNRSINRRVEFKILEK